MRGIFFIKLYQLFSYLSGKQKLTHVKTFPPYFNFFQLQLC